MTRLPAALAVTFAVTLAAALVPAGPAAADTLTFDGLFEQAEAAYEKGTRDFRSTYTEGAYALDYYANGINAAVSEGFSRGTLRIHDGGECCGEIDEARIARIDGRPFDLESFVISSVVSSFEAEYRAYDFSAADFALHPDWDGVEDVDTLDLDSILSNFTFAGLSIDVGFAFLDTVTEVADFIGPASYDAVKLLGTKADGSTVLARIDPFRDYEPCSYCPAQPAQRFTAADFGADLTDLVALELTMDMSDSTRILAQLGDIYPVFDPANAGPDRLYRDGTVVGQAYVQPAAHRNDGLMVSISEMTLPPTPVPLPAPALLLVAGLAGLAAMRHRRGG